MIFQKINFTQLKMLVLQNGAWSNAVFIFALAYFVIAIFSIPALTKPASLTDVMQESTSSSIEKPEETQMDFLLIKDWHLFGNREVTITEGELQVGETKKTDLPIKLLGIFLWPNQTATSYAIIEDEAKEQKKYHQGDELPGGVSLQSIEKEQVILLRNQQPEALTLDKQKTGLLFITQ